MRFFSAHFLLYPGLNEFGDKLTHNSTTLVEAISFVCFMASLGDIFDEVVRDDDDFVTFLLPCFWIFINILRQIPSIASGSSGLKTMICLMRARNSGVNAF